MKATWEKALEYASMPVHGTLSRRLGNGVKIQINEGAGYEGAVLFLGEEFVRVTEDAATGDAGHPFNPGRLAAIVETLEDCRRVYCTRIGENPAAELTRRGIQAVVYRGPIDRIEP